MRFPLSDGRVIGASFKIRYDIWRVQFPSPTEPKKYVEVSTGVRAIKTQPHADALSAAAKLVLKAYSPTLPTDPQKTTWEEAMKDVYEHSHLRERAWQVYTSILNVFRSIILDSKGPGDVTVETAKTFKQKYQNTPFKRSHKDDAKTYKRSAKTVENAIRRLSALWEKLTPKYVRQNVWEHIDRPQVPKTKPQVPSEDEVNQFFDWLDARYPTWQLPRLFVEVKALSGCRLNDLCQIKSYQLDPIKHTLTIKPDQDKTHRERTIPLPPDLSNALNAVKGNSYLWERYLEDSKKYRPGTRAKLRTAFTPKLMYHGMQNIFREYAEQGGKLRSHGLRKRAITLMTMATQNIDQTAQAIGIDAQTARKYILPGRETGVRDGRRVQAAGVNPPTAPEFRD